MWSGDGMAKQFSPVCALNADAGIRKGTQLSRSRCGVGPVRPGLYATSDFVVIHTVHECQRVIVTVFVNERRAVA
jgi:hypothetical protein